MNIDITKLSAEQVTWQLLGAMEAADHDFNRFAELTGMDPDEERAGFAYDLIHDAYAQMWRRMGDGFHQQLWPIADDWRTRSRVGRVKLAITRALHA